MSWFSSSEPYTPVMRKGNKRKPLTPEQARHILDNPFPTGYTYAQSSSYSINNPTDYINPNLSRSSLLSSSADSNSAFLHYDDKNRSYVSKAFWFIISFVSIFFRGIGDFLYANGYMVMQFMDDMKALLKGLTFSDNVRNGKQNSSWMLLFGFFTSLLLFWSSCTFRPSSPPATIFTISHQTCPSLNTVEALFYQQHPRQCLQSVVNDLLAEEKGKEGELISTAFTNTTSLPSSSAAATQQLEQELEKLRQDLRTISAAIHERGNTQSTEAAGAAIKKLERIIHDRFEAELSEYQGEQNELRKLQVEYGNHNVKSAHRGPTEKEINKLVQDSINKLNLSSIVEESVRQHLESKISEVEEHSNELNEKKIQTVIFDALRKYELDKTGEADYALESSGGNVLTTRDTKTSSLSSRRESLGGFWFADYIPLWYRSHSPRIVIQRKSLNVNPGECWSFDGSRGSLVIQLAQRINVSAITYEHVPVELTASGNITSAPKEFRVYSLQEENDPVKFLLGEYIFDDQGEPLQRFPVQRRDPRGTPIIEIEILSNYGASLTCLYRIRVHSSA